MAVTSVCNYVGDPVGWAHLVFVLPASVRNYQGLTRTRTKRENFREVLAHGAARLAPEIRHLALLYCEFYVTVLHVSSYDMKLCK